MRARLLFVLASSTFGCSPLLDSPEATFDGAGGGPARLENPSPEKKAYFGAMLASDGRAVLAAVSGASVGATPRAGAAYLFEKSSGQWQAQRITRPSPKPDDGTFPRDALPPERPDLYLNLLGYWPGVRVALDADLVVVSWAGVDGESGQELGTVCIYDRQSLVAPRECLMPEDLTARAAFGLNVALASEPGGQRRLAVGAPGTRSSPWGDPNPLAFPAGGAVYVYVERDGHFEFEAKVLAPIPSEGDFFGAAVALEGLDLAVGAPTEDGRTTGIQSAEPATVDDLTQAVGAVYAYRRIAVGWSFDRYIKPFETAKEGFFGLSLAISGDSLAIGHPAAHGCDGKSGASIPGGAVYIVARRGGEWSLNPGDCYWNSKVNLAGGFGFSVYLAQNQLLVGAPLDSGPVGAKGRSFSGAIYSMTRSGDGPWSEPEYLKAPTPEPGSLFGSSAFISSSLIATGAPLEGRIPAEIQESDDYGSIYVYSTEESQPLQQQNARGP